MFRSIVLLSLPFIMGCAAHAHTKGPVPASAPVAMHNHGTTHVSPTIIVEWTWVQPRSRRGHPNATGHWYHPHHGKSYRPHNKRPSAHRPHAHSTWESGRWEGRGHNRHWVAGRWN